MRPTRSNAASAYSRKARALWLVGLLFYASISFWLGCSTPEQKYRTLSFFFDGVPNPNAPVQVAGDEESGGVLSSAPRAFLHKPYAENKCSECHANASGQYQDFDKVSSDVCIKCHKDVRNKFAIMHGPVAAGECGFCHAPHESSVPHLLKEEPQIVCARCHVPELLSPNPPEHLMAEKNCLDCHVGHGADRHGLLKKVALAAPAATQPASRESKP